MQGVQRVAGFAAAVAIALSTAGCNFTSARIVGGAMEPTIAAGELVWISRAVGTPQRRDIVAFTVAPNQAQRKDAPGLPTGMIMRVIGLPGEEVRIVDGLVEINNIPLVEQYVRPERNVAQNFTSIRVPPGHYFMLGDNRMTSADSRAIGAISESAIWGKVLRK